MRIAYVFAPLVALTCAPAQAELPEPVRAMIEAAIATGDAAKVTTLVEIARQTNPDDVAEIDAMAQAFTAERAAQTAAEAAAAQTALRQSHMFDNWSGEGQIGAFQSSGNTDAVGLTAQLLE